MDIAELRSLFIFDGLTDEQLTELVTAGEEFVFAEGDVLFEQGAPADHWWVLLEGRVELSRRSEHEEIVLATMQQPGVWAGGFRAWSDTAGYMGWGRATSPGRAYRLPSEALGDFVRRWFPLGGHMIAAFFQTVRNIEGELRQRAGLVALGTLAAGLAHEINNPAAAAAHSAAALQESTDALLAALVSMAERSVSAEQLVALDRLRLEIEPPPGRLDSMALMDREEELTGWLERQGVDDAWRLAPVFVTAGVDTAWCERAADLLEGPQLGPGLHWVASTLSTTSLLSDVATSTSRVSALVEGVKSYTQMDRASLQRIDVTEGIESTLSVLAHKIGKGITVVRDYEEDLPHIDAHAAELNQVWTNLISNAIDAMDGEGALRLVARADGDSIVVDVGDTGPGMPDEVKDRVFEPFFTTKEVGQGVGLGLDISRRIVVDRHRGDITIESVPGNTVMSVRLPVEQ